MKKIVLKSQKQMELMEGPIPTPGPGEAVIRIRYAGICGSDLHIYNGLHPSAKTPLVLGHEGCGELYAINGGPDGFQAGDPVCAHTIRPCNACAFCTTARENLCDHIKIMGTNFDGVFTQYMLADANRLIRFAGGVEYRLAALAEPLAVAVHDVYASGLRAGERVLITGAGPIGLIIGMFAKYAGASCVFYSEIDPLRIQMAQSFGFLSSNPNDFSFQEACKDITRGAGFDRAFEMTSTQSGFDTCAAQVRKGGVMVQVGMPPAASRRSIDIDKIIYGEVSLRGVRHHTMSDMRRAVDIINSGRMNGQLSKLITAVYPMEDCTRAFERVQADKSMLKVLLDFS